MRLKVYAAIAAALIVAQSCTKNSSTDPTPNPTPTTIDNLVIPDNFNFTTGSNVQLVVNAADVNGNPLVGVRFDAYLKNGSESRLVQTFATDSKGAAQAYITAPAYFDSVQFVPQYIGIPGDVTVKIVNNIASVTYGAPSKSVSAMKSASATNGSINFKIGNTVFKTIVDFNSNGVPNNLEAKRDVVDAAFLDDVNASLPERYPVPDYNLPYLAKTNETNVIIKELSDVWVTFVHEGAGYRNVLGYYKYNLNKPFTSKDKIDTIFIILPNVSYYNSGGGLYSGDKVKIGRFPANTGIGWVCISDGFRNGTITANNWNWVFYSDPEFNSETVVAPDAKNIRQHNVLIYDNTRDKVLLGFEDIKRDQGSDNDFNDAVFYVTSNPVTAIQTGDLPPMKYSNSKPDADGDGIPDTSDDYPKDPSKAFNNWYPSSSTYGTLAYEDLWPAKGDYDINDMVIDYKINQITNASNKVVEVDGELILKAMGASYHNGFGMALGVPSNTISSATTTFKGVQGSLIKHGIATLGGNGLEVPVNNPYNNVSDEAIYIAFDDGYDILKYTGGGSGVNTTVGSSYSTPEPITFKILFSTPQNPAAMGNPPYNPFIFVNQIRGKEVHLQNMIPTGKADASLFMTAQDNTQPAKKKFYKTYKNLPWGIIFLDKFDYPTENTPIIDAFNFFAPWAESGGTVKTDWYLDKSGYRNSSKIYTK
jgi:LruC domain-containing protein